MGLLISSCMGHGDFQIPLQLVFAQLFLGVETMAFKDRLHRQEFDLILVFKCLCQFLKGWEPQPAAARSPVLKKIQVNYLAPIIA